MTADEEDDQEAFRIVREWAEPLRDRQHDMWSSTGPGEQPMHWIEDGQGGVQPASLMVWAAYMELDDRKVVQQDLVSKGFRGRYFISTVFLGLDHSFGMCGPPILYETMIFHASPLHILLNRLGLGRLVYTWECARWRIRFRWNIRLPSIVDTKYEGQWRYCTRAEAQLAHQKILEQIREGLPPDEWDSRIE